jgi:hypothetical protein
MSQVRSNGIQVPTNPDAFPNLTADLATMADTSNVVVKVNGATAQNALTKVAGLITTRTDLPGSPIQECDGTSFAQQQKPKVWANNVLVGSASSLLTNLQGGATIPIIQGGTTVGTTDANGNFGIIFPQAFPNGLITAVAYSGDSGVGNYIFSATASGVASPNLSAFYVNVKNTSGSNIGSTTVRFNWIAIGF